MTPLLITVNPLLHTPPFYANKYRRKWKKFESHFIQTQRQRETNKHLLPCMIQSWISRDGLCFSQTACGAITLYQVGGVLTYWYLVLGDMNDLFYFVENARWKFVSLTTIPHLFFSSSLYEDITKSIFSFVDPYFYVHRQ